jgi:hypothetical protein
MAKDTSWVKELSYHGLMVPSDEWLQQATHVHKYFNKFHPDKGFDRIIVSSKMHKNLPMT